MIILLVQLSIQLDQESSGHQYEQSLNSPLLKSKGVIAVTLAPYVADVSPTCRQILADIACRCDTEEAPAYPFYVNYSQQVQVSPNVRVSYPT